mmetsp:Transcript_17388/g.31371  ORF Transcript_17388/g.31371 Transcript_17388/m.31371 type:complete len:292 (+) Transcript_17388:214-1089(+)
MVKQSVREIFEQISLSVINYLERHIGVTDIEFIERQGVVETLITSWEAEHAPYLLPSDFKSFLLISDGLQLRWSVKKKNLVFPLGHMHLNRLREVQPFEIDRFILRKLGDEADCDSDDEVKGVRAFDIDSEVQSGRLALLYNGNYDKPQVYFQDLSADWFFIANTFTDYFRLMLMHLGLPHWQYAYTEVGLDSNAQQWFRFLSPERLEIDLKNRRERVKVKKHSKDHKKERQISNPIRRKNDPFSRLSSSNKRKDSSISVRSKHNSQPPKPKRSKAKRKKSTSEETKGEVA